MHIYIIYEWSDQRLSINIHILDIDLNIAEGLDLYL